MLNAISSILKIGERIQKWTPHQNNCIRVRSYIVVYYRYCGNLNIDAYSNKYEIYTTDTQVRVTGVIFNLDLHTDEAVLSHEHECILTT